MHTDILATLLDYTRKDKLMRLYFAIDCDKTLSIFINDKLYIRYNYYNSYYQYRNTLGYKFSMDSRNNEYRDLWIGAYKLTIKNGANNLYITDNVGNPRLVYSHYDDVAKDNFYYTLSKLLSDLIHNKNKKFYNLYKYMI